MCHRREWIMRTKQTEVAMYKLLTRSHFSAYGTYCLDNIYPPYCPKYWNGVGDKRCCKFVWYFRGVMMLNSPHCNKEKLPQLRPVFLLSTFPFNSLVLNHQRPFYKIQIYSKNNLNNRWWIDIVSQFCLVYATSHITKRWTVRWTKGRSKVLYAIRSNGTENQHHINLTIDLSKSTITSLAHHVPLVW